MVASYGDAVRTGQLREVWKPTGQDLDALVAAVADDPVERSATTGMPDEVRDRLILGGTCCQVPRSRMASNRWAILDTVGIS